MKKITIILALLISFSAFSQSREQILNALSELLKSQGNSSELFYIESEGFLDIHDHQVNLSLAKLRYEESNGPMLGFYCGYYNCIYNPKTKQEMSNFAFRMKDKEGVYQAIDLINKIQRAGDKGKVTGDPNASGYYGNGGGGGGGTTN